jgi:hypothetical protein
MALTLYALCRVQSFIVKLLNCCSLIPSVFYTFYLPSVFPLIPSLSCLSLDFCLYPTFLNHVIYLRMFLTLSLTNESFLMFSLYSFTSLIYQASAATGISDFRRFVHAYLVQIAKVPEQTVQYALTFPLGTSQVLSLFLCILFIC